VTSTNNERKIVSPSTCRVVSTNRDETFGDTLHRYRVYGITLASEFRHGLPDECGEDNGGVLVELRVAQSHTFPIQAEKLHDPSEWIQQDILDDGSLYMRWEDWLELLVSPDGRTVLCGNRSDSTLENFDSYLINFAVSAALLQQGEEPLHATVAAMDDCTVGLIGPSGAGKSTLAAYLINHGWDLVTDDMLRVTFEADAAFAHPGPYRLKLFRDPAERYLREAACRGLFNPASGQTGNPLNEKFIFQPGNEVGIRSARKLSGLFYLGQPSDVLQSSTVSVAELAGQNLFKTILSSTMNSQHQTPFRLERQFRFAERLVRTIPVYRLNYPRRYDVMDNVVDLIYHLARQ
jgi:hypothetical protein